MHHLRGTAYIQLGFIYRQTVLRRHRTEDQLHDEKRVVFLSFGIDIQSRRRHTGRPEPEYFLGRPDGHKFAESKQFHLAITPEGTRKPNPNWKKGFYFIALKAQVPIMLIGIDYPSKTITSTKAIMPTGDFEKDMHEIKLYFKDFHGKIPENFSIGTI